MIRIFNHRAALRAALAITGPALQSAPAVGPRDYQARAYCRRLAVGSLAISSGCLTCAACKEILMRDIIPLLLFIAFAVMIGYLLSRKK